MNNKGKIAIIGGVIVLFIVLLYFFGGAGGKQKEYVSDSWYETYSPDSKDPYGTYMLKELLDTTGLFGNFLELNKPLEDVLEDNDDVNDIYFFVGLTNYLDENSSWYLLDFVANGNTAFISAEAFPWDLMDELCYDTDMYFDDESSVDSVQYFLFTHSYLKNQRYRFEYIYENKAKMNEWLYFAEDAFFAEDEDHYIRVLGKNSKGKNNFVEIEYGEGSIFLHSSPYVFTNIAMMKRDGFRYAEHVLRHIPPGRVQWDKYNLNFNYEYEGEGGEERRSILEFLFKHPTLLWAVFILLIGALLYALFKGKRMQRIIPAAESKENTSMSYINTLSSLYLQESQHKKLIALKEKTFLNFIGEKYFITTQKVDARFVEKLAAKSQVEPEKITDIFKTFDNLKLVAVVDDEALIRLHQKIEYFYKNCR